MAGASDGDGAGAPRLVFGSQDGPRPGLDFVAGRGQALKTPIILIVHLQNNSAARLSQARRELADLAAL